jgi:hypothetical protein
MRIDFEHEGGTQPWNRDPMVDVWTPEEIFFEPALVVEYAMTPVKFQFWGPFGSTIWLDHITIDFTAHKA